MSPTQRSLKLLRELGYQAQIVERWNAHGGVRVDLFGCIDIVAVKRGIILGVQTTSYSCISSRVNKSLAESKLIVWLQAGALYQVWGWKKTRPPTVKIMQFYLKDSKLCYMEKG